MAADGYIPSAAAILDDPRDLWSWGRVLLGRVQARAVRAGYEMGMRRGSGKPRLV